MRRLRVHVKHVLSELSMCYSSTDPDPKWSNIIFLTLLNQKKLLADQICESSFIYMYSTLLNILFQSQLFNYHSLGHLIWLTSPYATSCDLKSHPHLLLAGVWNQLCSALGFGCLNDPNGACLIGLEQLRGNHMYWISRKHIRVKASKEDLELRPTEVFPKQAQPFMWNNSHQSLHLMWHEIHWGSF